METSKDISVDFIVENALSHHGIKGMRWGIRRKRNEDGLVEGESESQDTSDGKTPNNKNSKKSSLSVKDLSDEDLKAIVSRLQLERQLSDLTKETKKEHTGAKFAKEILLSVAKKQATAYLNMKVENALGISTGKAIKKMGVPGVSFTSNNDAHKKKDKKDKKGKKGKKGASGLEPKPFYTSQKLSTSDPMFGESMETVWTPGKRPKVRRKKF